MTVSSVNLNEQPSSPFSSIEAVHEQDSANRRANKMSSSLPPSTSVIPQGVGAPPPPGLDPKRGKLMCIKVRMLDDTVGVFHLGHKAIGQALFDEVCRHLNLLECDYFGLEFMDCYGNHVWLDKEKPILRQITSSQSDARFYFVVKFYTPNPADLEEEYTRFVFALQIKRDLGTGQFVVNENTAALMVSYIVQAECGDFSPEDYHDHTYLSCSRFVPNQSPEFEKKVMEHHMKLVGMSPADADLSLLETSRRCDFYGVKFHPARDIEGTPVNLACLHLGIRVYHQYTLASTFSWAKIRKMSFKRKKFLIKLHPESYQYYKDTIEFMFETRNESKGFWKKCVEHHAFFRCVEPGMQPKAKQQGSLFSKGSSFRYHGRTQKQLIDYVREHHKRREPFTRPIHSSFSNKPSSRLPGMTPQTDRSLPTPLLPVASRSGQNGDLQVHHVADGRLGGTPPYHQNHRAPGDGHHLPHETNGGSPPGTPKLHRKIKGENGGTTLVGYSQVRQVNAAQHNHHHSINTHPQHHQPQTISFHFPANVPPGASGSSWGDSPITPSPMDPVTRSEGDVMSHSLIGQEGGKGLSRPKVNGYYSDGERDQKLKLKQQHSGDFIMVSGPNAAKMAAGHLSGPENDDNVSEDSYHVGSDHEEPVAKPRVPPAVVPAKPESPKDNQIFSISKAVPSTHSSLPGSPNIPVSPIENASTSAGVPKTYGAVRPLPGKVLVRQAPVISANDRHDDDVDGNQHSSSSKQTVTSANSTAAALKKKQKPVPPPKPKLINITHPQHLRAAGIEGPPLIQVQSSERPDIQHKFLLNGEIPYVLHMRHVPKEENEQLEKEAQQARTEKTPEKVPFSTFKDPQGSKTIPSEITKNLPDSPSGASQRGRTAMRNEEPPAKLRQKSLDLVPRKRLPSPSNFSSQDHSVSPTTPESGSVTDYVMRRRSTSTDNGQRKKKCKRNDQRRQTQPIKFSVARRGELQCESVDAVIAAQSKSQPALPTNDPDYDSGDDLSMESRSLHEDMDALESLDVTSGRLSTSSMESFGPAVPPPLPPIQSDRLVSIQIKPFEGGIGNVDDVGFIDDGSPCPPFNSSNNESNVVQTRTTVVFGFQSQTQVHSGSPSDL